MTTKGILFSPPMVRALLDGRKTQTRRLAKPRGSRRPSLLSGEWTDSYVLDPGNAGWLAQDVPYVPGDRLWVREAWHVRLQATDVVEVGYRASAMRSHTEYVEQWPVERSVRGKGQWPRFPKYGPSIHMPRWASRLWLAVTDVRVQRLRDISEADARAEGVKVPSFWDQVAQSEPFPARIAYEHLWNSLHTDPGTTWVDNPWIVAVTFEVNRGNIDG